MPISSFRLLVCALALTTLAACTGSRPFTYPPLSVNSARTFEYQHNIELLRVSNGLVVAIVPDDNTNLVQVDMRYRVGAAEDPAGKEGLAHLVEHIMFELRSDKSQPTLTDRLRDTALFHNATTSWDETNYTSTAPSNKLKELLTIERDRLAADCSMLSDEMLLREKEIVRQEISWRNSTARTMGSILRKTFFPKGHPYHVQPGGFDTTVASITREDVCTFIDQHYAPNRAILTISGDVVAKQIPGIVAPIFGPVEKQAQGVRANLSTLKFSGSQSQHELELDDAAVTIAFPYPAWGSAELIHADIYTDILIERLNEIEGSKGLKSFEVGIIGESRTRAIVFAMTPDDPGQREAMVSLFFKESDSVLDKQDKRFFITRRTLKRATLVANLEAFQTRASQIADYLQYTDHLWFMLQDMNNLQKLLLPDLKSYKMSHFQRFQSHIAYFTPSGKADKKEVEVSTPSPEMDIASWKSLVPKGEADGPLAFVSNRVRPITDTFTMKNGLRVILAPDFEYPTIDMRLVFPVGDAMDPTDKPGLAYWTAIMLSTKMDDNWTATIWNRVVRVQEMGGTMSATTSDRSTVFRNSGLSMYADGLLWKLHWLIESGTVDGRLSRIQKLLRKQAETAAAKNKKITVSTSEKYSQALLTGLYGKNHPYSVDRQFIGVLRNLKASELERFRDKHYRADGATLIISGRFDSDQVRKRVESLFGSLPSRGQRQEMVSIPDAAKRSAPKRVLLVDSKRGHPQITLAFTAGRGVLKDRAVRNVVEAMIEQRMASVREKLGASYGVSVNYGVSHGPGSIVIRGTVNSGKGAAALTLILKQLDELRNGTNIRDDFARARRKVLRQALADTANASSVARQFVTQATYDLPADYEDQYASNISSLTLAAVRTRLAEDLASNKELLIIRGDKALGEAMFKEADVSEFETIK
ncbi:MAG: insulinase family protein [Kofleriaceae bacterium]|nr:insulinase family protein [Kofleriaceae bacterium]